MRPGEVRHDCGGCHAHSQRPTPFKLTAAAKADYKVFDLTRKTPLITSKQSDESKRRWDAKDETGVRYHMYHALGLFAVAWAASRWPSGATTAAGWLLIVGIVIFSGSLYALVLTGQRWLGAVTPVGGLALIAGWAALAWAALRS